MPDFDDAILANLSLKHRHFHPWSAGSLYEGVVSSVVGQSISVAAAATTERRLYSLFHPGIELDGRTFGPPPTAQQLAGAGADLVRSSGVTMKRAEALLALGQVFSVIDAEWIDSGPEALRRRAESLREIPGVGPWTVQSALLWGVADSDAHPTGDVALLRAARRFYPQVSTLRDLDTLAASWAPWRAWAARLLWLDLLGYEQREDG
jgi:3-methyladenine DNA glycosylase/8-oxoguanine DNA glycosylase